MSIIQSLEDLNQARNEAAERQVARDEAGEIVLRVGMGSCGIASGANETLAALRSQTTRSELSQVRIIPTGCIGLCALEPVVQVLAPGQPLITYGKVTPAVARRIIQKHIIGGLPITEYVVENV